jgi:putative MATE family efflux protein
VRYAKSNAMQRELEKDPASAGSNLIIWLGKASRARQVFLAAVRNEPHDFTTGSMRYALVLLAIPMVLEMGMESVFVLVDIFFVAQLGANAVATVGLTESFLTLLYAVAIGLSMGATALVARRIGERDVEAARVVAGQVIWIGVALAAAIGITGVVFAGDLLRLMGANGNVITNGSGFTRLMLGGSVTILLLFLFNAIFRGAGNAVIAMRALWLANSINIILDPCLILGLGPFPELGVTGAAVATNIGRGAGVAYQIYCLTRGHTDVTIDWSHLKLRSRILLRLLRVSIPAAFQFTIAMSSYLFLMRVISVYGSDAVAGFTIAIRIFAFTFLPAWGLANATATLVGQNLGAGQPERAEQSVWIAARYNAAILICVAIVFISFPQGFVSIFTDDASIVQYAIGCLRICSYGYGFYAVGMIVTQAFNGAGDTDTPTLINLVSFWILQIPLAYGLAQIAGLGPEGVYWAIAICDSLLASFAVIAFRRGRWKLRQV